MIDTNHLASALQLEGFHALGEVVSLGPFGMLGLKEVDIVAFDNDGIGCKAGQAIFGIVGADGEMP